VVDAGVLSVPARRDTSQAARRGRFLPIVSARPGCLGAAAISRLRTHDGSSPGEVRIASTRCRAMFVIAIASSISSLNAMAAPLSSNGPHSGEWGTA
jgi:hypothetical protein